MATSVTAEAELKQGEIARPAKHITFSASPGRGISLVKLVSSTARSAM
jgi:hypothetical protein